VWSPWRTRPIDRRRIPSDNATVTLGSAYALFLAAAAGAAAAGMLAVTHAAGYGHVVGVVRRFDPVWLPVCLGGQVVAYLGYVLAVRAVAGMDGGPRLPFSLTARTVVAGFGVYAATHSSGGFAVDYWALRRFGLARREAIARVLGLGALEYAVLAPAALVSAVVLLLGSGNHVQDAMTLPWLLVLPGFVAAAWLTSPKRAHRLADPASGGRARTAAAHLVAGAVTLRAIATRPREHAAGLAGVALYWLGDIACLWAALRLFSAEVAVPALILAYATGYVLTRRSLPLGGAGLVEVLMTFALAWVGVPLAAAALGVVVYRVFNFWLPIVPALAVLPTVKELRREYLDA
jgi:uncharacterized membrane protein YbhN (UPF0104 family)